MPLEIERKFLIDLSRWHPQGVARRLRQGYIPSDAATVRVRRDDSRGWITLKGAPMDTRQGVTRAEFEYEIPLADADWMLDNLCRRPLIEKTRHTFDHAGHTWEVDVFEQDNAGLVVAEIELTSEDEEFARPDWLGEEVSADPRYNNQQLSRVPFREWGA